MSSRGRYRSKSQEPGFPSRVVSVPIMRPLAQITSEELAAIREATALAKRLATYRARLTFDPDKVL